MSWYAVSDAAMACAETMMEEAAVANLYRYADRRRWQPFRASSRWLGQRWHPFGLSTRAIESLLRRLIEAGCVELAKAGDHRSARHLKVVDPAERRRERSAERSAERKSQSPERQRFRVQTPTCAWPVPRLS